MKVCSHLKGQRRVSARYVMREKEAKEYALEFVGSEADTQARHLLLRDRAVHEPRNVPFRTLILAP